MLASHVSRRSGVGNIPFWASRLMWRSLEVVYLVAAASPVAIIALLYALSWRAQVLLGHVPLSPSESRFLATGADGVLANLLGMLNTIFQWTPYGFLAVVFIGFALAYKHVNIWPLLLFGLYVLGWVVVGILSFTTSLFWYTIVETI